MCPAVVHSPLCALPLLKRLHVIRLVSVRVHKAVRCQCVDACRVTEYACQIHARYHVVCRKRLTSIENQSYSPCSLSLWSSLRRAGYRREQLGVLGRRDSFSFCRSALVLCVGVGGIAAHDEVGDAHGRSNRATHRPP
jgi:hypothetical protein